MASVTGEVPKPNAVASTDALVSSELPWSYLSFQACYLARSLSGLKQLDFRRDLQD